MSLEDVKNDSLHDVHSQQDDFFDFLGFLAQENRDVYGSRASVWRRDGKVFEITHAFSCVEDRDV